MNAINEAFSPTFRTSELNSIKTFKGKLDYCKQNLGPTFGKGSSRVIFEFTDETVLKLAYNQKGIAQNEEEYNQARYSWVVVNCFEVADDFSWIIEENVLPAKELDFEKCLGMPWEMFCKFIDSVYAEYGRGTIYGGMSDEDYEYLLEESKYSYWFHEMRDYMVNFRLPCGDLKRISSYGIVMRDGEPEIVVLDAGLNEEILNKFYRRPRLYENLNEDMVAEDVSVKPFEPKDSLNPNFWKNNKLNSVIRMRLLDIADDFVKTLDIRWVKPEDIVLTGSIANYNWTKYSDVDIHIIMDFTKVYPKKTDFVKSYFDAKKNEWNTSHEDLKIYGFNVELSVEDLNAPAAASGVYSLEKNDWVKEPKDLSDATINVDYIKTTAEKYIEKIDNIEEKIKQETDRKKIELLSDKMVAIFDKLKGMRKEGLKSKKRELSSGNIIWKVLRAEGYIKKIWDIVNYNYDRSMSLNEAVTGKDNKKAAALYVYALDKENGSWHILCAKRADIKGDDESGKWNPPMGHLHRTEKSIDGAIRECLEESGIDLTKYKSRIKLMDSHKWGDNFRLIIKKGYTEEFESGEGDGENEKFIWLPVDEISDKEWAYSCGENAKKYQPKTVVLKESQIKDLKEMLETTNATITLYHGVMADKLEYNLQNGGFSPRVCSEGGPKAVYLSEQPYGYQFVFKFEIPIDLLNKKLSQQTTVDYTFDDFISFDDFNCELVATNLHVNINSIDANINLCNIEMCNKQMEIIPEAFEKLEVEMQNYPLVFERIVKPKLDFLKKSQN